MIITSLYAGVLALLFLALSARAVVVVGDDHAGHGGALQERLFA